MADACFGAGGIGPDADTVGGSCYVADPADTVLLCDRHFVHAGHHQYMLRTCDQTGNTVSHAVHIDQFPVQGNGIGAGEKIICSDDPAIEGPGFLRGFGFLSVKQYVVTLL